MLGGVAIQAIGTGFDPPWGKQLRDSTYAALWRSYQLFHSLKQSICFIWNDAMVSTETIGLFPKWGRQVLRFFVSFATVNFYCVVVVKSVLSSGPPVTWLLFCNLFLSVSSMIWQSLQALSLHPVLNYLSPVNNIIIIMFCGNPLCQVALWEAGFL